MLLIQRLTLVFCFVLLIRNGVGSNVGNCQKALTELFQATSKSLDSLDRRPNRGRLPTLDYYFIPDDDLISSLAALENPSTTTSQAAPATVPTSPSEKQSNFIIQNPIEFGTEEHGFESVKFVVGLPDGSKKGTAKLVSTKTTGKDFLARLRHHMDTSGKLPCLEQPPAGSQPPKSNDEYSMQRMRASNGIRVILFGQKFDIFSADIILRYLIQAHSSSPKKTPSFVATSATFKDNFVTFQDKDGHKVGTETWVGTITWPTVNIEYIQAATNVLNAYKLGFVSVKPTSNFITRSLHHGYQGLKQGLKRVGLAY